MRKEDAFSRYHPLVNFVFFVLAIGFGVVLQHPAYIAAGVLGGGAYCLVRAPRSGWRLILGMLPVFAVLAAVNPLFNTDGTWVLFTLFGRPYTLEALFYGMAVGGIFVVMMLWFSGYSAVLTSDKFLCLFGSLIPALSLLLTMVLRLIPSLSRKARQILGSRGSIGKGVEGGSLRVRLLGGMTALSSLTDWALEGSVVTADSMRARGYGTARRTSFRLYRFTVRDGVLLALMLLLGAGTLLLGGFSATYTPALAIQAPGWGLAAYCALLSIPSALHIAESLRWRLALARVPAKEV